jgi:hypothetical protein
VPNRIITDIGAAFTARSFGTFANITLSTSTTPQSPSHGATPRSKDPTAWCFKLLRTVSTTTPPTTPHGG